MITKNKKFLWRKDDFVCPADLCKEIVRRTENKTQENSVREIDRLVEAANMAKFIVNTFLYRMMKSR
jgi:hypothetical protein